MSAASLSLLYGHRWAGWFGAYVGAKYIKGDVKAEYRAVKDGPIVDTQRRDFDAYGGLLGLYLNPRWKYVALYFLMEAQFMNAPVSYGSGRDWAPTLYTASFSLPFTFSP